MATVESTKTFEREDPRQQYCLQNSTSLEKCQMDLIENTLKHPLAGMLGSLDVTQFCSNLIRLIDARQILDVGVYTGNSCLAWAVASRPEAKVLAMDVTDQYYAAVGKEIVEKSGYVSKIEFHFQEATKTLDGLIANDRKSSFDFAFIDADKINYRNYYEKCLQLIRSGGIIAIDNALWFNRVLQQEKDASTTAIHELNLHIKSDQRVYCTLLPIGDGLMLVFKK
uniref:Caffeoyl-CoA O-methyltransferase n=1 Tax=Romanomermis culicivorax TaxID=13658 RepID=A0A915IZ23_ROMCU